MPHATLHSERLDAWCDDDSVSLVAIGARGEPLELSVGELEKFILKLQDCLSQLKDGSHSPRS